MDCDYSYDDVTLPKPKTYVSEHGGHTLSGSPAVLGNIWLEQTSFEETASAGSHAKHCNYKSNSSLDWVPL